MTSTFSTVLLFGLDMHGDDLAESVKGQTWDDFTRIVSWPININTY